MPPTPLFWEVQSKNRKVIQAKIMDRRATFFKNWLTPLKVIFKHIPSRQTDRRMTSYYRELDALVQFVTTDTPRNFPTFVWMLKLLSLLLSLLCASFSLVPIIFLPFLRTQYILILLIKVNHKGHKVNNKKHCWFR